MFLPHKPRFYSNSYFVVGCSCVSVLLLLLYIIAFIAPNWGWFEISSLGISTEVYFGLWSKCTAVGGDRTVCIDWTSSSSSGALIASKVFSVPAVVAATIATLMFVLMAMKNMVWREFVITNIALYFISAILNFFGIIAFILTIANSADSDKPSWGFYLSIASIVSCCLCGGYILLFANDTNILRKKRMKRTATNLEEPIILPSPRKIKVINIQENTDKEDEDMKKNKELIDSKII